MLSSLFAFLVALVVVVAVTPLVKRIALGVGAVDVPGHRRVHASSVPRLGGIGLVLAFFVPLVLLFAMNTQVAQVFYARPWHMVGLAVGAVLLSGLGVLDDIRGVRAWHKLGVQTAAATLAYACGFRIAAVSLPFVGNLEMGVFALPITVLWVVAIVNALNLIDGLDGLAGGIGFFACTTNFMVGAMHGDAVVMLLSASMGGALLGFLVYNFNPASIFMGDSGSLFLGFLLATTSILSHSVRSSTTIAILVPLIALGVPIIDTLLAMSRRFLERRPLFAPDRGHIHHQLIAMGLTHRRAVLILYGVSILFTGLALVVAIGRDWQVGVALLVLSVLLIAVVRSMGNLAASLRRWRRRERARPDSVERLRTQVPDLIAQIRELSSPTRLPELLRDFATATRLVTVETFRTEGGPLPGLIYANQSDGEAEPGSLVALQYAIPSAGPWAEIKFAWQAEESEASPEEDILLQLVVDACEQRLARSRLETEASRPAPAPQRRVRPVN
jgi:UDP-GlcNAc:undecaprenyl-phosphate GlcNAc-1-phosphate transferase